MMIPVNQAEQIIKKWVYHKGIMLGFKTNSCNIKKLYRINSNF